MRLSDYRRALLGWHFDMNPIAHTHTIATASSATVLAPPRMNGFDFRSMCPVDLEAADPDQLRALERIKPSVEFIVQHLDQPMSVAMLSRLVGLAESTFFALFKRATGRAPIEFVIRARMRIAGEMLRTSDLHIKQIAASLGYSDQFYFSRLFKSVHGVAPSDHRSGHRDSPDSARELVDRKGTTPRREPEDLDGYRGMETPRALNFTQPSVATARV